MINRVAPGVRSSFIPNQDIWNISDVRTEEELMIKVMKWKMDILKELRPSPRMTACKFNLNVLKTA